MSAPNLFHKLAAETIGTFWLVLGGVGSAVFSLKAQSDLFSLGIGYLGVALAFGLTVLTGVYAFGTISGGHFNPAVTLGAALARRVEWKVVPAYWIVQVIGGLLGALVVYFIAFGKPGFIATGHMAANGYGVHSPTGYSLGAVILAEIVLTAIFLFVILGSTDARAPKGFAGLAIGLTLTVIHLVAIPISNTSVNPARSTAVAFFNGDGAPAQLWVFWLAPLIGGAIAGIAYPFLFGRAEEGEQTTQERRRHHLQARDAADDTAISSTLTGVAYLRAGQHRVTDGERRADADPDRVAGPGRQAAHGKANPVIENGSDTAKISEGTGPGKPVGPVHRGRPHRFQDSRRHQISHAIARLAQASLSVCPAAACHDGADL